MKKNPHKLRFKGNTKTLVEIISNIAFLERVQRLTTNEERKAKLQHDIDSLKKLLQP
jgi:hypothetical protein